LFVQRVISDVRGRGIRLPHPVGITSAGRRRLWFRKDQ
jgi:hypothetical protein